MSDDGGDCPASGVARDERLAIRRYAMDRLARREHAYAELAAKLTRRGHARAEVETVLDTLVDEGLLSDARFAEASVAGKARRGIGPLRIRVELAQAGVDAAVIAQALAAAELDWAALAEAARRKRFGPDLPADFRSRAKQLRFLQRRGFDAGKLAAAFDDG